MKRLKIHICILLSTVFLFLPGLVAAAVHYVPTNDEFVVSGVTVNIGDILRIPILPPNAPNANSFSVQVILTHSPLPGGEAITLELTTLRGVGSAVFDNGSQSGSATISISQSTSAIVIRGVTNSSEEDNIMLSAKLHGSELASDVFTVRTWPIFNTFKLTGIECNPPNSCDNSSDGIMKAHYTMESESGKLSDINGNKIQEIVTFPILQICQLADAFCPSSPPYKDAKESLDEAKNDLNDNFIRGAISSSYYCFLHLMRALLLQK